MSQVPSFKPKLPTDSQDVAWVSVPALQSPAALAELCLDVEALFRVNPYYYFSSFHPTGPSGFHLVLENQSNQQKTAFDIDVTLGPGGGITVNYRGVIKKRTFFAIEPHEQGSRLLVVDDYESIPEEERKSRQAEVDKSLKAWGEALRVYFLHQHRYGKLPGWRRYLRRFWLPMKPNHRRIVWWLLVFTAIDTVVVVLGIGIYWIEHGP
jgi:hypothetical protein